jgi:hypothetical protein
MRALEGLSFDPRQNRRTSQLPSLAPGTALEERRPQCPATPVWEEPLRWRSLPSLAPSDGDTSPRALRFAVRTSQKTLARTED